MSQDYTSVLLYEDLTVVEFLEHCATVFRNKINPDIEIVSTPVNDHVVRDNNSVTIEKNRLTELQDESDELRLMNAEQKIMFGISKRDGDISGYKQYIEYGLGIRKKLIEMENQIQRWKAPSAEFELLQSFVAEQMRLAIVSNNEDIEHYEKELKICESRTPSDYYKLTVYQNKKEIEYYQNIISEKID